MAIVDIDSFSISQMQSKLWLAERLERVVEEYLERDKCRIWILAGWHGITNLILRTRNKIKISEVRSFDIDPSCEEIANSINRLWVYKAWEFKAHTQDINQLQYTPRPDIVINSSVEHMTSNTWFDLIPDGTLVCLQGSNMEDPDHVNIINDYRDLTKKYPLQEQVYEGKRYFEYGDKKFYRSMIIGIK